MRKSYLIVAVLAIGTFFYSSIEGWRLLDALYFSSVTLTTIGYGDLTPLTDAGKIFTIGYIFVGIGVMLSFINLVARHALSQYNPVRFLAQTAENIQETLKKE